MKLFSKIRSPYKDIEQLQELDIPKVKLPSFIRIHWLVLD